MLIMEQIRQVRERYYEGGESLSQIAREMNLAWRTVQKYVDKEDFNEQAAPIEKKPVASKLDPHKPLIDQWLMDDKKVNRKQRHSAMRVFNRLKAEVQGFDCSYRLVAEYVSERKEELNLRRDKQYLPLEHYPGEAQGDFGAAEFVEDGIPRSGKYFVLSFPYSNGGYFQLNYGENMECLLESLRAIFEHINGVPPEIWFDNASTIVTKYVKGSDRKLSERFLRFQMHYGFKPVFMNPSAGWEKGSVENKVGYYRRNLLVPTPRFLALADFNRQLLLDCDEDLKREHYRYPEQTLLERFAEDRKMLKPLPPTEFDTADYRAVKTNKWGKFTLNNGLHEYSVSPDYEETTVILKVMATEVIVMDTDYKEILRHRRLYGKDKEKLQSMQWLPYLQAISRKPRSLRNSGIYDMLPDVMQKYLDNCPNSERGKALKVLSALTARTGFESAITTVMQALEYHANDADSLQALYLRLYSDVPLLPPMPPDGTAPNIEPMSVNLSAFDALLEGGSKEHD